MVNQALTIQNDSWQVMTSQAEVLIKSGFLPSSIKTKEQALAIMMKGQELGVPAWAALTGIYIIQGTPTVSPQLMLAVINATGQLEDIQIQGDDKSCTVAMKRRGRTEHAETFTLDDASKMGLTGKDNWKKQVAVMLKWRAVSACARVVFPDVIVGLYTPEEIEPNYGVDEDGVIIEGSYSTPETKAAQKSKPAIVEEPEAEGYYSDEGYEEKSERTSNSILNDFEAILADGSQLAPEWRQQEFEPDNLEVLLLDQLVEEQTPVKVTGAVVIKTEKGLFYALDFGFNQNKKVILKMTVQKGDKADSKVLLKGIVATLSKTESGNYTATPLDEF